MDRKLYSLHHGVAGSQPRLFIIDTSAQEYITSLGLNGIAAKFNLQH